MSGPCFRLACIALTLLLSLAASAAPTDGSQTQATLVVQTLDGNTFDLTAERGKWVIVNYWATWCSPCIAEMPAISKFVAAHADVTAIGLAWDRSPRDEIMKFAHEHPVDYPLAQVDPEHPPAGFAAPVALPTTYLVAPDGHVAKHFIGPVDAQLLQAAITAAGPQPAVPSASTR